MLPKNIYYMYIPYSVAFIFCHAASQSKYTLCKGIKVEREEMKTFSYPVDCINIESDFWRALRKRHVGYNSIGNQPQPMFVAL